MSDPLQPSAALLCKLGSIIVHIEELNGPRGHHLDKHALTTVLEDPEVKKWMEEMDKQGLLPVKR